MEQRVIKLAEQLLIARASVRTPWDRYEDMADSAIRLAQAFYDKVEQRTAK